ncbi:MAG: hypothetical protein JWM10_727 [Myxococcaceae bacterium]|nr:hypothetical protein [Myxococcaceae bacterium]
MASEGGATPEKLQYDAWGIFVQTSNVRAVHIANGVMQLLRLLPGAAPPWAHLLATDQPLRAYVGAVKQALDARFGAGAWKLSDEARALCVTRTKDGPLRLDAPPHAADPKFLKRGRAHVRDHFASEEGFALTPAMHATVAAALNADGKVAVSGAADPTTPGLAFVGFNDPHTLGGMHAPTFLGMLSATPDGCRALAGLYDLACSSDDPHSALAVALGIGSATSPAPPLSPDEFVGAFPVPSGDGWAQWSKTVGTLARRLIEWHRFGASKSETLTAMIDLATLVLCVRLLRWRPDAGEGRLLLCVSPPDQAASMAQAVSRAQESLQRACAALNTAAEERLTLKKGGDANRYSPSTHALHLGAAGGWLFPLDARGGAKRYFKPGPRQLVTLTHALVDPGHAVPWPEFAARAEGLGLVLGGPNEHDTERRLGIGGVASTLREVGRANREHLVTLGLARRESDNVVLVDGGLQ